MAPPLAASFHWAAGLPRRIKTRGICPELLPRRFSGVMAVSQTRRVAMTFLHRRDLFKGSTQDFHQLLAVF